MSKTEHLALLVSVVGLSGCGPDVYKGPGKSSLCFNHLYTGEYLKEHCSVLSQDEFESNVINQQHCIYWGNKTEHFYKLPKSKKVTAERVLVTVTFDIFEQTEFIEDITRKSYPFKQEYAVRALKLTNTSNKLSFKSVPLIHSPEKYGAKVFTNPKGSQTGYIFVIDVSKGCPTFTHQLGLMKKMVKSKQKRFIIAATKFDQVDASSFREVQHVAAHLGVDVIPTSTETEDDGEYLVSEVFKYLAIRVFNIQSEYAYGVTGDSYLRYVPDQPPQLSKQLHSQSKSTDSETPDIPPRLYDLQDLLPESSPHSKINLNRKLSRSNPELADEQRTTEIPVNIKEKRAKTIDRKRIGIPLPIKTLPGGTGNQIDIPVRLPLDPSPPRPPKPQPSLSLIPKKPLVTTERTNRPLPKLPFVQDDNMSNQYGSFRCDYDKIDYTKMEELRRLRRRQPPLSQASNATNATPPPRVRPKSSRFTTDTVKAHSVDVPSASAMPPPGPKKPPITPRKVSAPANYIKLSPHLPTNSNMHSDGNDEYEDTRAYVIENPPQVSSMIMSSSTQPKYPPRCIPRKFYFLNGRRALPIT